jgi:hypothetical protein
LGQLWATPVRAKKSARAARVVPQLAEEGGRHQAAAVRLDPVQRHADVLGLHDDTNATRIEVLV